ncbi:hypothetical protein HCH52_05075 [Oscillospiraceae bacterium HV4-5-C5C]|nr:hypothetical protein [Oscillospiraceae bacterium HV4-5-C5C]
MTVNDFKNMMMINEPAFAYHDEEYSICWPDNQYHVTASDHPSDINFVFESLDDLLDNWMIQGRPLRQILPDITLI